LTDDTSTGLREATLMGVRWFSIARLIAETTAIASTLALARMISPAEFGRAAVALIVVSLAAILGPAGLTASLVQSKDVDREYLESATFLSLAVGAALTMATIALDPVTSALLGKATADLVLLAAPAWLITGAGATSQAMLQRSLRFRRIALVDSVSVIAGASTALLLALLGFDAEAVVGGGVVALLAANLLAVIASPPPPPRPTRRGVAQVGGFATPVTLSSLAYSCFRNVDYLILGARMSAADVGYYWRAYQLGVVYQEKISQIMLRISFPVFSRTETLEELRRVRMRIVRVHATVLVPLLGALVGVAPVAIPWLFGPQWEAAVVPAQILAVAGIGDVLVTGTGPLMVAIGRPGILLAWNVAELALYAAMIYVLAPYGLVTVSIGVAAFSIVSMVLTQVALLRRLIGLPIRASVAEMLPGFATAACIAVALAALRSVLESTSVPSVLLLAVCGAAGLVLYVGILRFVFRATWDDLASIAQRAVDVRRGHRPTRRR
jgi:O-antigen/teichoic acid export membrane protein